MNRTQRVNQQRLRRLWQRQRRHVRRVAHKRQRQRRPARVQAADPGPIWAYAVVEDAVADGTPVRILTVMDACTRAGLASDVAVTSSAERVMGVRTARVAQHGAPTQLRRDNGPACVATAIQVWLAQGGSQTLSIDPGKPWHNGKEERFNGTVRDAWLTMHVCGALAEAGVRRSACRHHDTTERPHSALGYLTPLACKPAWLEAQAQLQDP